MLKMLSDTFVAGDTGQTPLLGLLDLTAVFHTVDHAILIERLRLTFGMVDSALHWMTSYLTGRTQYVRYREVSTTTHVYCGVPQGSVLGPVLFPLYVADVIELVKECDLIPHVFADDLQICGHSVSADTQEQVTRMTTCIERVHYWMASNHLRLNPNKTELIWLRSPRRTNLLSTSPIHLFGHCNTAFSVRPESQSYRCQHMSAISPACASTICVSYDLFDDL